MGIFEKFRNNRGKFHIFHIFFAVRFEKVEQANLSGCFPLSAVCYLIFCSGIVESGSSGSRELAIAKIVKICKKNIFKLLYDEKKRSELKECLSEYSRILKISIAID